jgi:hypothetical protein
VGTPLLSRLTPKPIYFNTGEVTGGLYIDGNLEYRRLLFRFKFERSEEMTPLFVEIETAENKMYRYCCDLYDFNNPIIKSKILNVDFPLYGIKVVKVMPIITYLQKEKKKRNFFNVFWEKVRQIIYMVYGGKK